MTILRNWSALIDLGNVPCWLAIDNRTRILRAAYRRSIRRTDADCTRAKNMCILNTFVKIVCSGFWTRNEDIALRNAVGWEIVKTESGNRLNVVTTKGMVHARARTPVTCHSALSDAQKIISKLLQNDVRKMTLILLWSDWSELPTNEKIEWNRHIIEKEWDWDGAVKRFAVQNVTMVSSFNGVVFEDKRIIVSSAYSATKSVVLPPELSG